MCSQYCSEPKKRRRKQTCYLYFPYSPHFSEQKTVFKNCNQTNPNSPALDHSTHLITLDYSTLNYSMVLPNSKSSFIVLHTFVILTFFFFSKRPDCIWNMGIVLYLENAIRQFDMSLCWGHHRSSGLPIFHQNIFLPLLHQSMLIEAFAFKNQ